jgi:hypothetical protein
MKNTFTPGPWLINGKTIEALAAPKESKTYYAPICTMDDDWTGEITEANARLIASAPDLLHELTELLETFKGCLGGSDPLYYEDFYAEIERAQAAIHKAKNG